MKECLLLARNVPESAPVVAFKIIPMANLTAFDHNLRIDSKKPIETIRGITKRPGLLDDQQVFHDPGHFRFPLGQSQKRGCHDTRSPSKMGVDLSTSGVRPKHDKTHENKAFLSIPSNFGRAYESSALTD
jgi:hypothetical protein